MYAGDSHSVRTGDPDSRCANVGAAQCIAQAALDFYAVPQKYLTFPGYICKSSNSIGENPFFICIVGFLSRIQSDSSP